MLPRQRQRLDQRVREPIGLHRDRDAGPRRDAAADEHRDAGARAAGPRGPRRRARRRDRRPIADSATSATSLRATKRREVCRREVRARGSRPSSRPPPGPAPGTTSPIMCCSPATPASTASGPIRPSGPRSGRIRSSARSRVRDARCSSATLQRPFSQRSPTSVMASRSRPSKTSARVCSARAWRRVHAASSSSPSARRPASSSGGEGVGGDVGGRGRVHGREADREVVAHGRTLASRAAARRLLARRA